MIRFLLSIAWNQCAEWFVKFCNPKQKRRSTVIHKHLTETTLMVIGEYWLIQQTEHFCKETRQISHSWHQLITWKKKVKWWIGFSWVSDTRQGNHYIWLPASKGWWEVMFTQYVSVQLWGSTPSSWQGEIPHPRSRQQGVVTHHRSRWGYPIPGLGGGTPILPDRGYLYPRSGWRGTTFSWQGLPPPFLLGYPHLRSRWGDTCIPGLDRRYPTKLMDGGTPILSDGEPIPGQEVPPSFLTGGTPGYSAPSRTGWDTPPSRNHPPCPGLDGAPLPP